MSITLIPLGQVWYQWFGRSSLPQRGEHICSSGRFHPLHEERRCCDFELDCSLSRGFRLADKSPEGAAHPALSLEALKAHAMLIVL